jgi:hypothetical protein
MKTITMRRHTPFRLPALVFLLLTSTSWSLHAQTSQSGLVSAIPGGSAANFYYAKPGDLTILVDVWGMVQRPGRYEISSNIDLLHLISLAGGPMEDAKLDEVKITRLVGYDSTAHRRKITVNLEDVSRLSERDLALAPGDIIVLERTSWAKIRDVFAFVLPVATIALAVLNIIYILRR